MPVQSVTTDLDHRLTKLEKELKQMKDGNYEKLIDLISGKIDSNLTAYLPKVQTVIYDFEDFKMAVEPEMANVKKAYEHQIPNIMGQIDGLRKDIESARNSSEGGSQQKNNYSIQEIYRKVQEHDRQLKKVITSFEIMPTPEQFKEVESRLGYTVSEDFMLNTTANMKESLKADIKKAVEMIVNVDLQMQMNYINRDDFNEKMTELDDKLVNKMGITEFNDALQQFDEDLKEENKETYEYIQSVKKHFAVVTKEIDKIREDFRAYDDRLAAKTSTEETQQIWDNFNRFAFYDDLKDLYNRTLPELSKFEERIIKQNAMLEKSEIILRRYDEVITEKASKHDFKDLEKMVKTQYTANIDFKEIVEKLNERIT